jgi:hypothetical protein
MTTTTLPRGFAIFAEDAPDRPVFFPAAFAAVCRDPAKPENKSPLCELLEDNTGDNAGDDDDSEGEIVFRLGVHATRNDLVRIYEYFSHHRHNPAAKLPASSIGKLFVKHVSEFDARFVLSLAHPDPRELFRLACVADYLVYYDLVELLMFYISISFVQADNPRATIASAFNEQPLSEKQIEEIRTHALHSFINKPITSTAKKQELFPHLFM